MAKEERLTAETNKVDEWNSKHPESESKLRKQVDTIKYSFSLGGIRIGFSSMSPNNGVIAMENVLLAFPIQIEKEIIHNFIVYKKVILYCNTLIYPS